MKTTPGPDCCACSDCDEPLLYGSHWGRCPDETACLKRQVRRLEKAVRLLLAGHNYTLEQFKS